MTQNREAFRRAGIYVPAGGTQPGNAAGHHGVALGLRGTDPHAALGPFIDELKRAVEPAFLISSEQFSSLALEPERLRLFADGLRSADLDVTVLVYLRSQAAWAESIYGERARHSMYATMPVATYVDNIIEHRGHLATPPSGLLPFDYSEMLGPFADAFGKGAIIARAYPVGTEPTALYNDFLSAIAKMYPPATASGAQLVIQSERIHDGLSFAELLRLTFERTYPSVHGDPVPELMLRFRNESSDFWSKRFRLLSREESLAITRAFADNNKQLEAEFGLHLPSDERDLPAPADARWETARKQRAIYEECLKSWLAGVT